MVLVKPEDYSGENPDPALVRYRDKTPKNVLQFSDGVMEEYSTDEEDSSPAQDVVDPATLTWGPWMLYQTWAAGSSTLSFLDYIGEFLASFFGITTPRYYFELEEYKRRKANEEERAEQQKGWSTTTSEVIDVPLKNLSGGQQGQPRIEPV